MNTLKKEKKTLPVTQMLIFEILRIFHFPKIGINVQNTI